MMATTAEETTSRKASELRRIIRLGHAISHAAYGPQNVNAELLAQTANEYFDGVRIAIEILVIEMFDQFSARYHLALMMHEIGEQAEFQRSEFDRVAIDGDTRTLGVEQQGATGDFACRMTGRASQKSAHPRQHFLHVEWLGHIVISTGIKPLHLVAPAIASGQDEHRHFPVVAAPLLQNADRIEDWQAEVEDDSVIGLGFAKIMALFAVLGGIDHITSIGESRYKLTVQIRIVFDDEQSHEYPLVRRAQFCTAPVSPSTRIFLTWFSILTVAMMSPLGKGPILSTLALGMTIWIFCCATDRGIDGGLTGALLTLGWILNFGCT